MAELRINATGGVKLYDADDSHYAQIIAGTITSNVDAITLGHDTVTIADNLSLGSDSAVLKFGADGDTTLTHTDGTGLTLNSTNKLCFNDASQFIQGSSNAILSLGATDEIDLTATAVDLNGTLDVSGATTTAAITASGIVKTDDATEATSTTDGSLQTDGGLSVVKDAVFGDDVKLLSDSSVIAFGADGEVTLTHVHNDGLLLNSDNQLQFRDSAINIRSDADGDLDINADDEIELNSTLIDINGNVEISGTATTTGVHTFSATPVFPDGSLALADLDIDGGTDIGAAIVDADLFIIDDGAGGTNRKTAASRLKTYVGGGITDYDVWYLTTDFTGAASPIASNLASLASSGTAHLGSAMTQSSGVFTFPKTGMWQIIFNHYHYGDYNSRFVTGAIQADSGAGYGERAAHTTHLQDVDLDTAQYAGGTCMWFFDVTNVSTCFVKFYVNTENSNVTTVGNATGVNNMHFIRIGDT